MRISSCLPVVAASLALAACASSPKAPPPKPPPQYTGHFSEFPSGLRLASYRLPLATRGVVVTSFLGGSADDPVGKEGLAVLSGRLSQRARPGGGARLSDRLLALGVEHGVDVEADSLVVWQVGAPSEVDAMLRIEGERLRDPASGLTQEDLDRERAAMLHALSAPPESGDAPSLSWLSQLAFAGHAYDRPPLGSAASLRAITLEDVRGWLRARITPAGGVLVVTSPGLASAAARSVANHYQEAAHGDGAAFVAALAPGPRQPPPEKPSRPNELRRSASPRTALWLAWAVPAKAVSDRAYAVRAAVSAAAAVENGLSRAAAEEVIAITPDVHPRSGATLVTMRLDVTGEAAAAAVLKEALALLDEPYPVAGDAALVSFSRGRAPVRFAAEAARHVQLTERPDLAADWAQVPAAPAKAWMRAHVTGQRAVALTVAPDPHAPARPQPLLALTSILAHTGTEFEPHPVDDDPLAADCSDLGAALAATRAQGVERRVLANGLTVLAVPVRDQVLYGRLVVRSPGSSADDLTAAALALASGRRTFSFAGPLSCGSAVATAQDSVHFTNVADVSRLEDLVERLSCWTGGISAQKETYRGLEGPLAKYFEAMSRSTAVRGWDAMRAALYPGHALSAPMSEGGRHVDRDAARAWMDDAMRPARAVVLLTGNMTDPAAAADRAAAQFVKWRSGKAARPAPPAAPWPERRRVLLVPQQGARGAHVTIALRAPPADVRDHPAHRAAARLLEARLTGLRSDVDISGVIVAQHDGGAGAAVLASAVVESIDPSATVRAMLGVLERLDDTEPSQQLVRRVQLEQLKEARERFASPGSALALSTQAVAVGEPLDAWVAEPDSIAALTPARVRAAAAALAIGREVVVVVGEAWLEASLRAAGFEVELLPDPEQTTATR